MKLIVAICGRRRSGKDTIANHLERNYGFRNHKIAGKLKSVCSELFGLTPNQLEGDEKDCVDPKWQTSPRRIMQFVGTDLMQYQLQKLLPCVGRKLWIQSLLNDIECSSNSERIVISDMRFMHEYEEIRKHKAFTVVMIRVKRRSLDTDTGEVDHHASEAESDLIPVDVEITNEDTVSHLYSCIDHFLATQRIQQMRQTRGSAVDLSMFGGTSVRK
jgi:dephospho-CoA kinase